MNSKDTARLGMESLLEVSQDPLAMKELMSSLDDPETMKEVEKLMKDPTFISEIENLKNDPQFIRQFSAASDLYNDPLKQARVMGQIRAHQAIQEKERQQQQQHHQSDVELGLSELAKAAKNPKMLADAMEALKDPEVAREVGSKSQMMMEMMMTINYTIIQLAKMMIIITMLVILILIDYKLLGQSYDGGPRLQRGDAKADF